MISKNFFSGGTNARIGVNLHMSIGVDINLLRNIILNFKIIKGACAPFVLYQGSLMCSKSIEMWNTPDPYSCCETHHITNHD